MTVRAPRPAEESLHTKKQEFVRHEIWVAAMDLFAAAGFDETTIDQIATRANVSRRTFFRYFSSKEDVMAAAMKGYGVALSLALREQPAKLTPFEAAQAVVLSIAGRVTVSPFAEQALSIAKRSPSARSAQLLELPVILDDLSRVFAERMGNAEGKEYTCPLLANLTLMVTNLSIEKWVAEPEQPIEHVVDRAFAALTGICCNGGNKSKAPPRSMADHKSRSAR